MSAEVAHSDDVSQAIDDDAASVYSTFTSGDHEAEGQPLLHQASPAEHLPSGAEAVAPHTAGGAAAVFASRGASRGGVGDYWEGAQGNTVPEDLFSHKIMEEGECGPVDLDATEVNSKRVIGVIMSYDSRRCRCRRSFFFFMILRETDKIKA